MTVLTRLHLRPLLIGVVVIVVAVLFLESADAQYLYIGDSALVAAIGAIGLNVLTGTAGQVSIGNAAFIGIGAYTAVLLDSHLPFLLVVLIGGVVAAVVGLAIGIPSLRLRGLYLVFSTLALQFTVSYVFTEYDSNTDAISGHEIAVPKIGSFALASDRDWYYFLLVVVVIISVIVWSVLRGRPGRAWDAIRANEASAAIMGIDVRRTKLNAFVFSSFIVGVCGAITAYFVQNVSGDYFTLDMAVSYVAMILIGGLGSIGGAIAGAIIVTALPTLTTTISTNLFNAGSSTGFIQENLSAIDAGVYGVLILVFMFTEPAGIAGMARRAGALISRLIGVRRGGSPRPDGSDGAGGVDGPDAPSGPRPEPPASARSQPRTPTLATVSREDLR
jgi:branched-chain amino acid transport system permease protein